jgi:copper chaperone NosL
MRLVTLLVILACSRGPVGPAALDTRNEACAHCRMAVSSQRFAGQLVAPGEEPRFFDDLACLAAYLKAHPQLPRGASAYVADHRTGDWVLADRAVYSRAAVETPMGSHLIAHASAASRDLDPAARESVPAALEARQ